MFENFSSKILKINFQCYQLRSISSKRTGQHPGNVCHSQGALHRPQRGGGTGWDTMSFSLLYPWHTVVSTQWEKKWMATEVAVNLWVWTVFWNQSRYLWPRAGHSHHMTCKHSPISRAAAVLYIWWRDVYDPPSSQAQARCHRIGQSKAVKVYRLITRNSYEREMFDKASLKLGLDKAVLQDINRKGGTNGVSVMGLLWSLKEHWSHSPGGLLLRLFQGSLSLHWASPHIIIG